MKPKLKQLAALVLVIGCLNFSACVMYKTIQFPEADHHVEVFDDVLGTKDQLYLKANRWMAYVFNDAQSVIQHNDKEEGVIIGRYLMGGTVQTNQYGSEDSRVYATIEIRVKNNKARIEIKPQREWKYDAGEMTIFDYSKEDAIAEMKQLAELFHQSLLKNDVDF